MSYTSNNWQTGDTVTAERLNKMESGIADSGYWIKLVPDMNLMTFVVPQDIAEEVQTKMSDINVNINGFILYDINDTLLTVVGGVKTATSTDPSVIGYIHSGTALSRDFLGGFSGKIILESHPGEFSVIPVKFIPDTFIVTLTPTAQDFSGTMDKTPEEIDEAYRTGRRIRFRIMGMDAEVDATQYLDNTTPPEYYQAAANVIYNGMLVQILTSRTDQIYVTLVYTLTTMS